MADEKKTEEKEFKRFWVVPDGVGGLEVSEKPIVDHWGTVTPVVEYGALNQMSNRYAVLQDAMLALKEEVEILRQYGNKDCTAMADERLAEIRKNRR